MHTFAIAVLATIVAVGASPAYAQSYPQRPVRLVTPSSPGGTSDIVGRLLAHKLGEQMGQQFVVENRAGAGGTIGYDYVAKSASDGYTLLIAPSSIAINSSMYSKLPYSLRDFAPISLIIAAANVMCVHPSVPAASVKALIALAKAKPDSLVAGSAGSGTSPHLSLELFKSMAGIDFVIVHYKGSGPNMIALLSGENALAMPSLPTVIQYLKAGRLRALGVSSAKRTPLLPAIPTIAESGLADFEATNWFGIYAPANTPRPVIERLHQEILRALRSPEFKDRLVAEGADVIGSTPDELASHMKSESEKWARVIKAAGIKPE